MEIPPKYSPIADMLDRFYESDLKAEEDFFEDIEEIDCDPKIDNNKQATST